MKDSNVHEMAAAEQFSEWVSGASSMKNIEYTTSMLYEDFQSSHGDIVVRFSDFKWMLSTSGIKRRVSNGTTYYRPSDKPAPVSSDKAGLLEWIETIPRGVMAKSSLVYGLYCGWAESKRTPVVSIKMFGTMMRESGAIVKRRNDGTYYEVQP